MNRFTNTGFLLLFLFSFFSPSIAGDTLTPLRPLIDGETLVSASGRFVLGFFSPAGSKNRYVGIWYGQVSVCTVVWVANRRNPITGGTGNLTLANNGSLVITAHNSTALWSSSVSGMHNPVAQLLDKGNFVVRELNNADSESFAWQSFDHPTDTFLPGMKLGWNLATGLNRNITGWTSATDPSPGRYSVAMDVQGDPQVVLLDGLTRVWRSGPWDGSDFTGIPEILTLNKFGYTFVNNQSEVYYMFDVMSDSFLSKVTVDSNGTVKRMDWINESAQWSMFWYAPKGQCDYISACGPYGMCIDNEPSSCDCVPGFKPKSPALWAQGNWRDGCVRKTALDCRGGTDGFITVSKTKLPDTTNATVDINLSLEECRTKCLSNCSCTAYTSANVTNGGSGCVTWTSHLTDVKVYLDSGSDFFLRLASSDLGPISNNTKKRKQPFILIIVGVVLGILLISSIIYLALTKRKRKEGQITRNQYQHDNASEVNLDLPLFDMRTIAFATDNFSEHNKIGEGGFGSVYKGKLEVGEEIAVKRLDKSSTQGLDEFKNEATLIARLQHRNLVRLLGCCIEGEERMLVYEYMPNKSLDAILFEKSKGAILNWQTRYCIIMGIARGLLYLHQDSRFKIIHRDLKASNVLLDKELNPKISDFGMARIFRADETEANTKKVVGTYGYMSPEYVWDGIFSVKSDVYSFGVLVLEIISGKKNKASYLSEPHENLLVHAWSLWREGNGLDIVDHLVGHSFPLNEVLRCITIGLLCVQELPEDRPTMSTVVLMLSSDDMLLPQPKKPGFVIGRDFFKMKLSSATSKQGMCSINNVTISALDGR